MAAFTRMFQRLRSMVAITRSPFLAAGGASTAVLAPARSESASPGLQRAEDFFERAIGCAQTILFRVIVVWRESQHLAFWPNNCRAFAI